MFYTAFYVIVMIILAVLNGIQFGASRGLGFRRVVNVFQILVFVAVPVAYVVEGQTSAFHFWTIIAFFVCAMMDIIELTLISCGKIKVELKEPKGSKQSSQRRGKRGVLDTIHEKGESFTQENPRASHALSVIFSLLLTVGVFLVSILLVTGYLFV